jgi:predicted dehydrogenase
MIEDGRPIRVGLIGYGYAGKTFHAPLIKSVSGLDLTVVGSSKRDVVLADLPNVAVHSNMDDVATHPEVDLVVIASPNESHYPLAAAALQAGKHVVVDKPFTVNLADARSLGQRAKERGKLLSVFHNRRWDSEVLATKAILESGVLGEIRHFESHIDRFRPQVRQRWRETAGPGAGLWFDLGPHLIDQALQLFGLPQTINASFAVLRKGGETDDWAHVQLNYMSLRVILHASLLVAGGAPRSALHGTLGSWAKFGADVQERQLVAGLPPDSPGFGDDPDLGIYYVGIRDALWGRRFNPIPPEQASAVMSILETSFQSDSKGQVLAVHLTDGERAAFPITMN